MAVVDGEPISEIETACASFRSSIAIHVMGRLTELYLQQSIAMLKKDLEEQLREQQELPQELRVTADEATTIAIGFQNFGGLAAKLSAHAADTLIEALGVRRRLT